MPPSNPPAKTAPKKLTPKTMAHYQGIDLIELGNHRPIEPRHLYDLYGVIVGVKQRENDYGLWTQFKGEFEAVTPEGESVEAFAAHIPVIEDMLLAHLRGAQEQDSRASVRVAVAIGIAPPADPKKPSATGYEFTVRNLLNVTSDSPVKALRREVEAGLKQLAAPKDGETATSNGSTAAEPSSNTANSSAPANPATSEPNPKHSRGKHASA